MITDSREEADTIPTDKSVSRPNFVENIVVVAAAGADDAIVQATNTSPETLHNHITSNETKGIATRLNAIEIYAPASLKILPRLVWDK